MIIRENGNLLTAKNVEVICIATTTSPEPEGLMHFLSLKYPKIFQRHKSYLTQDLCSGTSSLHCVGENKIVALLYIHKKIDDMMFCDYAVLEERLQYIQEIYSDKIVGLSINNIISDGNRDHLDVVDYIVESIYGDIRDTSIIKLFS